MSIKQTAGRDSLGEFAPDFAHYNDDILFGENWNNQDIDLKTRCIITVVALMSSGITDSSLRYHLENAKKNGVTKAEIAAIITHTAFYVGWPKGWAAFNMAKEIWNEAVLSMMQKQLMPQVWFFRSENQMMHMHNISSVKAISHRFPQVRSEFLM